MMKKDFNYAKKRKNRKKWYMVETKEYLCPFWIAILIPILAIAKKVIEWQDKRIKWNDEKATKLLTNYILPQNLEWIEKDNAYYYYTSWEEENFYHNVPYRYRKWTKKFCHNKLPMFLITNYENPNYIKTVERDGINYLIKFVEKR